MLELSDRDLEVAIIKMLQQAIMDFLKQMKNTKLSKSRNFEENPMQIVELEDTIIKIKPYRWAQPQRGAERTESVN